MKSTIESKARRLPIYLSERHSSDRTFAYQTLEKESDTITETEIGRKKRSVFLFCDGEEAYTGRMVEFLGMKKNLPFDIRAFTSVEKLEEYLQTERADVLLIDEGLTEVFTMRDRVDKAAVLVTDEDAVTGPDTILKYQSSEKILEGILELFPRGKQKQLFADRKIMAECCFIGVFSPVKRCGKTSFALCAAKYLSMNRKTLYLNFEEYPGFDILCGQEDCDLSMMLLHLIAEGDFTADVLMKNVRSMSGFDYIPPGINHGDMRSLSFEQLFIVLETIREQKLYEAVVMDLGDCMDSMAEILNYCDQVYMPVLEDNVSKAKINEFLWVIQCSDYPQLADSMIQLKVPREDIWTWWSSGGGEESALQRFTGNILGDVKDDQT